MTSAYYKKDFDEWNQKKKHLQAKDHRPPLVSERDIWWVSVGENIGSEVNGKSKLFSRPAIVFKKLAHGFYFIIPTSTKAHVGSWYVPIRQNGINMVACLHQVRVIDYRRLSSKLGELDDEDSQRVSEGFRSLYLDKNIPRR